jgi:hypothetical protein
MSNARFWFAPMKDIAPAEQQAQLAAKDEVRASDLPASFNVPSKLYQEGIRAGHVLALHDGDTVTALARVLALDRAGSLHWRRLPMLEAPELSATPELREVKGDEAAKFKIGIDAILRDVPASAGPTAEPTVPAKSYTPTEPASNIILYGPPGTGKTHSVRRRALELIGDREATTAPLSEVNAEWDRLGREGQIVFCTFHQAFAYEEFVEGLRARTEDGDVHYEVAPGIFKLLALTAAADGLANAEDTADPDFDTRWSLLVTALQAEPRVVKSKSNRDYLLETSARENVRAFSGETDQDGVFSKAKDASPLIASRETLKLAWSKRGSLGADPSTTTLAEQIGGAATVVWMAYRELQKVTAAQPVVVVDRYERSRRAFAAGQAFAFGAGIRQHVLVIDEINRANMARVFGELITLLEPDKRLGSANELRVQLPSSKEWFGVPPNLHVIGTMNTADRSIALMDVALRRRFTFEEMMPDAGKLSEQLEKQISDESIRKLVLATFEKLNERLRFLYDREHQAGHAYFFDVKSLEDLRRVFATKIIPLLQEYFFGRWEKVALALGHPRKSDEWDMTAEHTVLRVRAVAGKDVLGFNHDDYEDLQLEWEVRPEFLPRVKTQPENAWLEKTFGQIVRGSKGT